MKKLFILALLLIPITVLAATFDGSTFTKLDGVIVTKWDGMIVSSGGTCTLYESATGATTTTSFGYSNTRVTGGQTWKPTANKSVCKIVSSFGKVTGSLSGKNLIAEICSVSTGSVTGVLGRSSPASAVDAYSSASRTFDFSSPVSVTSGTVYGVRFCVDYDANGQCDSTDWDASNYQAMDRGAIVAPFDDATEYVAQWDGSGNLTGQVTTATAKIEVWTQ